MNKQARTDFPIHELIANRWSPYGFADRPVAQAELCSLLEAARWAPSSYNEQPWSYILATKEDPAAFAKLLSCLVEGNQSWAQAAPVLLLCCTSLHFSRNGKPNTAALHDLGLAAGNLCLEATARGLAVHQMIGIEPEKSRELYSIPEGVQPLTAMAIGYAADPAELSDKLAERDTTPRQRKSLSEFVFAGQWGESASLS
ncbi:MAG: nitroreductase family protein [Novipirellula sp. JB048]